MKILFLGELSAGQTSLMRMRALQRLGHEVIGLNTIEPWKKASWMQRQIQRRAQYGPIIKDLNYSILTTARQFRPDLIWAEKQEYVTAETLRQIKSLEIVTVHYTPDPYFSLNWKRTRRMDEAFHEFDALVYCKKYESEDYKRLNKPLIYMALGYCDETHRPMPSNDPRWASTVGFLGGWEPRRERLLHKVASTGVEFKIWGGYWDFLKDGRWTLRRQIILRQLAEGDGFRFHRDELLMRCYQGGEVYGDDYAKALSGSEIGLGLLRRVCPDQHTTRSFEIPATGSMLLADRTEEHQYYFEEGAEVELFDSDEELMSKIEFYTKNETARRRIASAGRRRCISGNYAYIHRMKRALDDIAEMLNYSL